MDTLNRQQQQIQRIDDFTRDMAVNWESQYHNWIRPTNDVDEVMGEANEIDEGVNTGDDQEGQQGSGGEDDDDDDFTDFS